MSIEIGIGATVKSTDSCTVPVLVGPVSSERTVASLVSSDVVFLVSGGFVYDGVRILKYWKYVVYFFLAWCVCTYAVFIVYNVVTRVPGSQVVGAIALFFQSMTTIPMVLICRERVQMEATALEEIALSRVHLWCRRFFVFCVLLAIGVMAYPLSSVPPGWAELFLSDVPTVISVSFPSVWTMLIIGLDSLSTKLEINRLTQLAVHETLTIFEYKTVRDRIAMKLKQSETMYNAAAAVGYLNVICLNAVLVLSQDWSQDVYFLLWMLREVVFFVALLPVIAQANDAFDELNDAVMNSALPQTATPEYVDSITCDRRLMLASVVRALPISVQLFGQSLSTSSVYAQLAGFAFSSIVTFIVFITGNS